MEKVLKNNVVAVAMAVLFLFTTACGTFMHPERSGQPKGQLDTSVIVMDGILLFFFIIPGLIAFAVDFSNNTIYLPPGEGHSSVPDSESEMRVIHLDEEPDKAAVEAALSEETGEEVNLSSAEWRLIKAKSRALGSSG